MGDSLVIGPNGQYQRTRHEPERQLRETLEERYRATCILATSGVHASFMVLSHTFVDLLSKGYKTLLYGSELYSGTPRQIRRLCKLYGLQALAFDVHQGSEFESLVRKYAKEGIIVFIESASNPSGDILDFQLLQQLKEEYSKIQVIVDNTWLSQVIFNPLDYGADHVVISLTKYYSGGRRIAGAVLSRDLTFFEKLFNQNMLQGIYLSPEHCEVISKALSTMEERIGKTSHMTSKIVREICQEFPTLEVRHSSQKSDRSYEKAQLYYKKLNGETLHPSVFSIYLEMSEEEAIVWMQGTKFSYVTSYGSHETRFDPWPRKKGSKTLCRLAVGYEEDAERITSELKKHLEKII